MDTLLMWLWLPAPILAGSFVHISALLPVLLAGHRSYPHCPLSSSPSPTAQHIAFITRSPIFKHENIENNSDVEPWVATGRAELR